jgi:hypothetical protein
MMKYIGLLFLLTTLCACGGSGGGSSNTSTPDDTAPVAAPDATIIFPPPDVLTDADTLQVTGTASGDAGVSSVTVSGIAANSSDGFASWRAQIPLSFGQNTITVATAGGNGNSDSTAAQIDISRQRLLNDVRAFDFDPATGAAYIIDDGNEIFQTDINDTDRSLLSSSERGSGPDFFNIVSLALDISGNQLLVLDSSLRAVFQVDLDTGDRGILSDDSDSTNGDIAVGSGPGFLGASHILLDAVNSRLLITDVSLDALFSVDLDNGNRSVISDDADSTNGGVAVGTGPAFNNPSGMAIDSAGSNAFVMDRSANAIYQVDLANGNRVIIASNSLGDGNSFTQPRDLVRDPVSGTLYVYSNGLLQVDPASGDRITISDNNSGGEPFQSPFNLFLDTAGDRLLILDIEIEGIISVDLDNGDRSIVIRDRHGSGTLLTDASDLILNRDNNRMLVPDGGVGKLVDIDLSTHDRGTNDGPGIVLDGPAAITLDNSTGQALIYDLNTADIVSLDPTDDTRTLVSSAFSPTLGAGPDLLFVRGLTLDAGGLIHAIDASLGAVLSVDPVSGDRVVISDDNDSTNGNIVVGSGPALANPGNIIFDVNNNQLLVADQTLSALIAVDPANGNRTVISDDNDSTNSNIMVGSGPGFSSPKGLWIDADEGDLIVGDIRTILNVDTSNGDRSVISSNSKGDGPPFKSSGGVFKDDQTGIIYFVDTGYGALFAIEPDSGDRVIVSR